MAYRFGSGCSRLARRCVSGSQGIDANWAGDILETLLAPVLKGQRQLALKLVEDFARDANAARIGEALQTNCHVHAITKDVSIFADDKVT
jgi:hypothetical protein